IVQIGRIALLEPAVGETEALCSTVAGLDEVVGDVDTQDVRPEPRSRYRGGPVAASEVEDAESVGDSQLLDERLAAFSHALGDASEVALFPECLVRIHRLASFRAFRGWTCGPNSVDLTFTKPSSRAPRRSSRRRSWSRLARSRR